MAAKKNPFPGMNPFLERSWRDLHTSLVTYARDTVQKSLPPALRARAEERVFLERIDDRKSRGGFSPDVVVVEHPDWAGGGGTAVAGRPVAKPLKFKVPLSETVQRFLEIIDASNGNRVVTTIEFLSPSNKLPGKGRKLYLKKREACQEADVNFVEIDLQRRGKPTTLAHDVILRLDFPTPYHASVWRATEPDEGECYPMPLREPLPVIAIPLRKEDADVALDLQALVDLAYINGHYDATDYRRRPDPPFAEDDEAWIDSVLAGME